MSKHIFLAELAAAILVALIFAVVCGRARGEAPPPAWNAAQVEIAAERRAAPLSQGLFTFRQPRDHSTTSTNALPPTKTCQT